MYADTGCIWYMPRNTWMYFYVRGYRMYLVHVQKYMDVFLCTVFLAAYALML